MRPMMWAILTVVLFIITLVGYTAFTILGVDSGDAWYTVLAYLILVIGIFATMCSFFSMFHAAGNSVSVDKDQDE